MPTASARPAASPAAAGTPAAWPPAAPRRQWLRQVGAGLAARALPAALGAGGLLAGCAPAPRRPPAGTAGEPPATASPDPATEPPAGPAAASPEPPRPPEARDAATAADAAGDPREPPPAPREWRGAWIASVANIDWPRRAGPDAADPATVRRLLDQAATLGLNALVLQVRPAADALYAGALEPWSEFLSGRQGRAPRGGDPLALWVGEAHRRGLELHAWFNPFRARAAGAASPPDPAHVSRRRPAWVRPYGRQLWMDPGEPEAAEHTLAVIEDVARRYDIDGVHVDDYFYPYPVPGPDGADLPFPDEPAWQRYRAAGGRLARADWRRDNVDRFVQALDARVHALRPTLRLSISPFGIGRPSLRPPGIEGFSQYDGLYADVERWCAEGWFDALLPQLYWPIDAPAQAFEVLADHWLAHNPHGRHVWPGLYADRVGKGARPWPAEEILAQVAALRRRPGCSGHCHFSLSVLAEDRSGLATRLARERYRGPALVPATPWRTGGAPPPAAPRLADDDDGWRIAPGDGRTPRRWAVWRHRAGRWHFDAPPGDQARLPRLGAERIVASAVDALGIEGPRSGSPG
ncbi:glycoside hydrolase family 10 protein [Piscinibacter sakaiensis]|uniref:Putative glycoside hydrolase n=1 Tax=Piscinibacter sakaiensis TaxID=1547922 RepID=A0A0K8P7J8_PISS1|nr:family 10 glycosylhydrolase [Piscinibacter sakaiensis]GAP38504.1 putative glycoside hydrolase [Piscinibacter sakaiensis]